MSEANGVTCKSCRFWKHTTTVAGAADLSKGECRFNPPQVLVVGMTREGPMMAACYPPVGDTTPACAKYESKVALFEG